MREGLTRAGYDPDRGVRIVVESILWDDQLSSAAAFEAAARDAIAGGPTDLDHFIASLEALPAAEIKEDIYFTEGPKFMRITFLPTGASVLRKIDRSSHATRRELMAELRSKIRSDRSS